MSLRVHYYSDWPLRSWKKSNLHQPTKLVFGTERTIVLLLLVSSHICGKHYLFAIQMSCWWLSSVTNTSQYAVRSTVCNLIRRNKRQGHCIVPKQPGPQGGHRSVWTLLALLCYRNSHEGNTGMSQQGNWLQKRHTMLGRQWGWAKLLLDGCCPRHSVGPPVSL